MSKFPRLVLLFASLALLLPAAENPRPPEVVQQIYAYSCGTGAIVNFVVLLGGQAPTEIKLIDKYVELRGLQAAQAIRENGFSLLDLKILMTSLGYKTAGIRYEADTMPEDAQPMIVHLLLGKISHFAVFAGMERDKVILLDSVRGRLQLSPEQFLKEWDGTALCLLSRTDDPASVSPARGEPAPAKANDHVPVFAR